MRRVLLLAVFGSAIPLVVFGIQEPAKPKPTPSAGQQMGAVEQTITKLDRELLDAAVQNDQALLGRVALERYIFINPGGGIQEKGDTQGPKIESIQTEDVQVRVHGDTAILTGKANVKGRFDDGRDISGPYRYMRVFVKQKDQWRLAATQITAIAPSMTTPSPTPKP